VESYSGISVTLKSMLNGTQKGLSIFSNTMLSYEQTFSFLEAPEAKTSNHFGSDLGL
jgi:hypothetical protein